MKFKKILSVVGLIGSLGLISSSCAGLGNPNCGRNKHPYWCEVSARLVNESFIPICEKHFAIKLCIPMPSNGWPKDEASRKDIAVEIAKTWKTEVFAAFDIPKGQIIDSMVVDRCVYGDAMPKDFNEYVNLGRFGPLNSIISLHSSKERNASDCRLCAANSCNLIACANEKVCTCWVNCSPTGDDTICTQECGAADATTLALADCLRSDACSGACGLDICESNPVVTPITPDCGGIASFGEGCFVDEDCKNCKCGGGIAGGTKTCQ